MDSDPDIEFIEKDSGMSSLGGSKDETPERRSAPPPPIEVEEILVQAEAVAEPKVELVEDKPISPSTKAAEPATTTTATVATKDADTENYDDEPDETFGERLMGLTEMFPDSVRSLTGNLLSYTGCTVKSLYAFSCNASWIFFTSSAILFAPVIFETERAQMFEMQKTQQKQVLLGPGTAVAAAGSSSNVSMPVMR